MPSDQHPPDEGKAQSAPPSGAVPGEPRMPSGARPPPVELENVYFDDGPVEAPPPVTPLRLFDAEPGRERVRAALALILVLLFAMMVVSSLAAAIISDSTGNRLKPLLDTLLPPVVALCGSAIGFYYAGRPNQ